MISHPRDDVDAPPAPHSLMPNEPKAPIAILTPAKRAALIACLTGGGTLYRQRGVWVPSVSSSDKRISGITVADLGRDGMLTLSILADTPRRTSPRVEAGSPEQQQRPW